MLRDLPLDYPDFTKCQQKGRPATSIFPTDPATHQPAVHFNSPSHERQIAHPDSYTQLSTETAQPDTSTTISHAHVQAAHIVNHSGISCEVYRELDSYVPGCPDAIQSFLLKQQAYAQQLLEGQPLAMVDITPHHNFTPYLLLVSPGSHLFDLMLALHRHAEDRPAHRTFAVLPDDHGRIATTDTSATHIPKIRHPLQSAC